MGVGHGKNINISSVARLLDADFAKDSLSS